MRGVPVVPLSRLSAVPTSAKQDVSGFSNLMSDTICSAFWLATCAVFPAFNSTLWLATRALAPASPASRSALWLATRALAPASWPRTRARRPICDACWLATSAPDESEAL
jgi:hypothetical protein